MAAPIRKLICGRGGVSLNTYLQVRYKHLNIKHPHPRHIPRRVFDEITAPIYLPEDYLPSATCERGQITEETEVNPYETFILNRWARVFNDTNKLIVICQPFPMSANDYRDVRTKLKEKGFNLTRSNNKLVSQTIQGTRFELMQPWIVGINDIIYSEGNDIKDLLKFLKKLPSLQVLGGFLEDRLLTKAGLTMAAELPSIELVRGELVSILNMAGGSRTLSLLNSHQQSLTSNLSQYVKQNQDTSQPSKEAEAAHTEEVDVQSSQNAPDTTPDSLKQNNPDTSDDKT